MIANDTDCLEKEIVNENERTEGNGLTSYIKTSLEPRNYRFEPRNYRVFNYFSFDYNYDFNFLLRTSYFL